jgi:nanoRNase/pAp phosphatase (c-di-AMP/oligoRNAs hydrolase)
VNAHLDSMLGTLSGLPEILILPHNDPDPDAIAAAVALRYLLVEKLDVGVHIAYRGIIGRAENKALVRYLDHPLRRLTGTDLRQLPLVLVDTQPGTGNNAAKPQSNVVGVIDHHAWRDASEGMSYVDVRPQLGATSTILTEYLQAADLALSPELATALFYGIKTDTMGLIRGASADDLSAYFYLQPLIDVEALVEIERAQVPVEYFERLAATLRAARVYGKVILSHVGGMSRPDMAAEMADLLLRLRGIEWVVCTGVYKDRLVLAVRTRARRGGAGLLAQDIVGQRGAAGGHGSMAGGQIRLQGRHAKRLASRLGRRALQYLKIEAAVEGKPIL